jgi:outer membrane lipoprotein carrier protein
MTRLLSGFLLLFAAGAHAASIERFQSFLRSTQTAQATFEQRVFDRNRTLVQTAKGSFAFQRPGRFRWAYDKPQSQVIVGDGEKVWIWDADLNQVTVKRLARAIGSTPAALLAGSADIAQAFVLQDAGVRDGLEWLEAKPREAESGFERIRLGMSSSGVEAMELLDSFGQTTVLKFINLSRNPQIDAGTFRFTPPKGADVLGDK